MTFSPNEQPDSAPVRWYGVRTRSNHERVAATVLQSKGYEQYVPVYRKRTRWSDRVVESDRPLFPGYVFCRFDAKKRMPVLKTPGVISVVGFGNEPAPIEDSEIDVIKEVLASEHAMEPCAFLRNGQRVRINRGSLQGVEGILMKKKNQCRIVLSIGMLQRSIAVEIDGEWISAA